MWESNKFLDKSPLTNVIEWNSHLAKAVGALASFRGM